MGTKKKTAAKRPDATGKTSPATGPETPPRDAGSRGHTAPLLDGIAVHGEDAEALRGPLANWLTLQAVMGTWTEAELLRAMVVERAGRNRMSMLQRLYARFAKVRREREQREILFGSVANETARESD